MATRTLTIQIWGGLCNRLGGLMTAHRWAQQSQRQLRVYWAPGPDIGCRWLDLFRPWFRDCAKPVRVQYDLTPGAAYQSWRKTWRPIIQQALLSRQRDVTLKVHWYLHDLCSPEGRAEADQLFTQLFVPTPRLVTRLTDLLKTVPFPALGVHVRRGDFLSPTHWRPAAVRVYVKEAKRRFQLGGFRSVYLATDDGAAHQLGEVPRPEDSENVREQFLAAFGPQLCQQPAVLVDRSFGLAIQQAFLDLLVLRRCSHVVGTRGSSFTTLASVGRPFTLL